MVYHAAPSLLPGGFLGVDVFFVISGYLITGILVSSDEPLGVALKTFWVRRIRRILPALLVCILGTLLLGMAILPPDPFQTLARSAIAAVFSVSNIFFWRQPRGYFHGAAGDNPLVHTWSLGVEEQFYLLYPLLVLIVARWRRQWLVPAITIGTVFSFAFALWLRTQDPAAAFYLLPSRAWELGIGALTWFAAQHLAGRRVRPWAADWLGFVALIALAGSFVLLNGRTGSVGWGALPAVLGAALLILCAAPERGIGRLLSLKFVVGIGLISYSLYLWHQPLLALSRVAFADFESLRTTIAPLALLASVPLAWASWRFIERPLRSAQFAEPKALGGIALAAGAACAMALLIISNRGIPARFAPEVQRVIELQSREDRERVERGQCALRNEGWRSPPGTCLVPAGGAPKIAVIGDSHASALFPVISKEAERRGQSAVLAFAGRCRPIDNGNDPNTDRKRCASYSRQVVEYLDATPSVEAVVLAYHWNALVDPAAPILPREGAAGEVAALIAALAGNDRRVLVMDPVPMAKVPGIPATYAANLGGRAIPAGETYQEYRERTAPVRAMLDAVQVERMQRFDPGPLLCDLENGACELTKNDRILLRDNHHLTTEGAEIALRSGLLEAALAGPEN